jgi:EAL domain-containing protein (putative c-di-GMP-specific phosphodiesterase class I)/ActR/RegA family two-component response regulator
MIETAERRLLAIDDEKGLLSILHDAGTSVGYQVETTTSPEYFLRKTREWLPTLIIMDLQRPEIDGVELLRRLATERISAPIVLMSGVDDKLLRAVGDLGAELGLNMRGILTKPIRLETFKVTLEENAAPSAARTVDELRAGIEHGELLLHYQPIVRLPDRGLVAVEALVRWQHPTRGLIGPDHFIPLAEANGLIDDLTAFVVREAIAQAARWGAQGNPLSVSINLSALNLVDPTFPDRVEALCREHDVNPERIWLELTETATNRDPMSLKVILTRLRLKRFRLAIDDFGIGYSSLMQLRTLPFNELKIDKSFVNDMLNSEDASIIIDAVLALAGAFRMDVVAEGIETEAQLAALMRRGCTMVQGYLLARPQPADHISPPVDALDARR